MSHYRRARFCGGYYFFTVVTYRRRKILVGNPVKHGLAKDVDDWPWSTYHKYVESGRYGKVDLEEMQEHIGDVFVGE